MRAIVCPGRMLPVLSRDTLLDDQLAGCAEVFIDQELLRRVMEPADDITITIPGLSLRLAERVAAKYSDGGWQAEALTKPEGAAVRLSGLNVLPSGPPNGQLGISAMDFVRRHIIDFENRKGMKPVSVAVDRTLFSLLSSEIKRFSLHLSNEVAELTDRDLKFMGVEVFVAPIGYEGLRLPPKETQ